MPKTIDTEDVLPRSWELRSTRPHSYMPTLTVAWQSLRRVSDSWLDFSFTCRLLYRYYKSQYGYAFGPVVIGLPACILWAQVLRTYNRRLKAGRLRYQYHAPEYVRLPPPGFEKAPPWADLPIDTPRGDRVPASSFLEEQMEAGSRFNHMHRPAWQKALLQDAMRAKQQGSDAPSPKCLR